MTDLKVIREGLEICSIREKSGKSECKKCPYRIHEIDCREMLYEDLLRFMDEYEERCGGKDE